MGELLMKKIIITVLIIFSALFQTGCVTYTTYDSNNNTYYSYTGPTDLYSKKVDYVGYGLGGHGFGGYGMGGYGLSGYAGRWQDI
jgi:hypothetical protein